jgi:hypothetical protein
LRKEREEIFASVVVPILVCLALVGDALGYHPCVTLRQENPLIWEPPLQHHKLEKKQAAPPVLLINPCIQVIIQAIVSSVRSNYSKQLSFIVSVEGE